MIPQPLPRPERPTLSTGAVAAKVPRAGDPPPDFDRVLDGPPKEPPAISSSSGLAPSLAPSSASSPAPAPALAAGPAPLPPELATFAAQLENGASWESASGWTDGDERARDDGELPVSYFNGSDAMLQVLAQLLPANVLRLVNGGSARQGEPVSASVQEGDAMQNAPPFRTMRTAESSVSRQVGALDGWTFHTTDESHLLRDKPNASHQRPSVLAASLETHLEPVGVQPAYVQVAHKLESALSSVYEPSLSQSPTAPIAGVPHILPDAPKAPLQVLRLQLQPAELGSVEVRLHLRAGDIHVRIAVESADVRLQLETSADRLGMALREKGFDVQSVVITQDAPQTRNQESQGRSNSDNSQRHQGEHEQRGAFDRERPDRRDHARGRSDRDRDTLDSFAG